MNRRDFLRTSAVLTASLMVAPNLLRSRQVTAAGETDSMELWLLGTGREELAPELYAEVFLRLSPSRLYLPLVQT